MRILRTLLCGAICLSAMSLASAATVTWQVNGVTFDDGGTASGSFDYDTDTGLLSAWNITTSATGPAIPFSGHNYTETNSSLIMPDGPYTFTLRNGFSGDPDYNDPAFVFLWLGNLDGSGGDLVLSQSSFECADACGLAQRGVVAGNATVVPVPAAAWLFGSGLLGLAGAARRKTA